MYTYKIYKDHPEPQAHRCLYVKRQHVTLITACGLHIQASIFLYKALPEMRAGFIIDRLLALEKWEPYTMIFGVLFVLGFLFVCFFLFQTM